MIIPSSHWQARGNVWRTQEKSLIVAGFIAACVILALVGWQSYRDAIRVAEAAEARKHSFEIRTVLDDTAARLVDAETGQRGFLLTGDEAYLEPYGNAIKNVDHLLGQLKSFTTENPEEQKRLQELEVLTEKKLEELQNTIDLRRTKGLPAANELVLQGQGKRWMDQIRGVLAEMQEHEDRIRAVQTQKMADALKRTSRIVVTGNFLSALLLAGVFVVLLCVLAERRRAQEAAEASEKWLSTTLASIGDGVIATDMNGAVSFMNPVAESLTGWRLVDARAKSMDLVFDIVSKETRQPVENPVKKVFREGQVAGLADHTILLSKGGKEFEIEDRAAPILTSSGEGLGVVLVFRDITEHKRAEQSLRQSEERYHLLFDSNPHPVWVYDLKTLAILDVNPAAIRNYGYSREEFLSLTIKGLRPWEDVPTLLENTARAPRDTETVSFWKHRKKDGTLIDVEITSHPLAYGGRDARLVVATDISIRKKAEEALVRAKEEAERTGKFKDQFLSTMSHELRTPLNAVLGFSDLLADERCGPLNEKQQRYIKHIHTGGNHLLTLINAILDLSKIEAGRMELAMESIIVDAAFAEVLSVMHPLADKKSQRLSASADPGVRVRADATRFKQVLMNLLGNAIKFTPNGGRIELAARLERSRVCIEVRDSGPGIPPKEQKRIFEAFYQLRESGKKTEGTGLGLAITQRLIELHGGELSLTSAVRQGSCFYFSLPAVPATRQSSTHKTSPTLTANGLARILVIEDDRMAAQLLQSQLTSAGYQVTLCEEPAKALELAAQLQPSAITLDIVMKPKNGWEVMTQLKRDQRTAHIPLIVVSIVDQPRMGALLGADEYLVKPVNQATLVRAIVRHVGTQQAAKPARPVLVVEHDTATREFIAEMLSSQGYVVATAVDGAQARAQVAACLPQLVILDLILPEVSGFELLGEWRASPRTTRLPIFVLTSKDLSPEEQSYLRSHTEALLCKQQPWHQALFRQLERVVVRGTSGKL